MGLRSSIKARFGYSQESTHGEKEGRITTPDSATNGSHDEEQGDAPDERPVPNKSSIGAEKGIQEAGGVAKIEAIQAVWGKKGRYFLWLGLAMITIIFALDFATLMVYQTIAASYFNQLPLIATLQTAGSLISATFKPPLAKISDVIGRGEAFLIATSFYILSYIMCAVAPSFNVFAGGYVFYYIGQTGLQVLISIMVSDISSMKWRGIAYNAIYVPYIIIPWLSAFIIDSVQNGIGWRWGIGMFAIIMPFCACFIIVTLLYYQRKAKKEKLIITETPSLYEFCSQIDLGGVGILCAGFTLVLLPVTLATTSRGSWRALWVDILIPVGGVFIICFYPYERYIAKHPIIPPRYFRDWSIVFSVLLAIFDNMGFYGTHTYLYAWAIVAHNYSPRVATFLNVTNGVTQCVFGMITGVIMYKTRSYRWIAFGGTIIRLVGYGIMIRLRGANNTTGELFAVQLIQGMGSGIIETTVVVAAQVVVAHAELAQVTALVLLSIFLGASIGSAVAGGIYSSSLKHRLRYHLGPAITQVEIDTLYSSITGVLPEWGTPERIAVNAAYSDVMRYISIAAAILAGPMIIFAWFTPDIYLGDGHNLTVCNEGVGEKTEELVVNRDVNILGPNGVIQEEEDDGFGHEGK